VDVVLGVDRLARIGLGVDVVESRVTVGRHGGGGAKSAGLLPEGKRARIIDG
jgi:hypothetical protein